MNNRTKISKNALTPMDRPTGDFSVRPVSMMHSWMHALEIDVPMQAVIDVIRGGNDPEWHAHNADRWAITVFVPGEHIYEIEGDGEYKSRGMMYYVMPDAIQQLPGDCRPKSA